MQRRQGRFSRTRLILLTSSVITLISQVYFNAFSDQFRLSLSVVLFPLLLLAAGRGKLFIAPSLTTAGMVFGFRMALWVPGGNGELSEGIRQVAPGALFYLAYGLLFSVLIRNKHTVRIPRLAVSIFFCDFISNLFEVWMRGELHLSSFDRTCAYLMLVALARTLLAGALLAMGEQYRSLLTREEHENRYQRLFLMTTGLKNEVYFMRKNSEEIEAIMKNAYQLFERCAELGLPEETRSLALAIARDVHEIKKDYIRIIQGIEKEIDEQYDNETMRFCDLLQILKDATYRHLDMKGLDIYLDFQCGQDFVLKEHYSLMVVLKNLVNNACEAIESAHRKGSIHVSEWKEGPDFLFRIEDNGIGIAEKNLRRIFQMGFSTKFDEKTGNIYRGVGLSGVKIVVEEQFGGSLEVESTQGAGTAFIVRIPADRLEGE